MILQALYTYLSNPGDLSQPAFFTAVRLGDLTIANRNDARRHLRNIIGTRIYRSRRMEETAEGHSAITMRVIGSDVSYHLQGENPAETTFVQIDHWSTGNGGMGRAVVMAELLRLAISGYLGKWDTTPVLSVTLESQLEIPVAPDGVDVYWTARMSQTWKIRSCRGVAEYPVGSAVADGEAVVVD